MAALSGKRALLSWLTEESVLDLSSLDRTVTALPSGDIFVNTTGNPGMATGGSGDVLAGMILSLLSQGVEAKPAAPSAVCLHGQAGDLAAEDKGEHGMTPTDLIEQIPYAMKELI